MNRFSLEGLSWELSVLARAVVYKNLSGAAANVGISQPQLSRILNKLETELRCVLLDRGSRRKSGWTPLAFQLAEVHQKSARGLYAEVAKLLEGNEPRLVHVGTLEGLIPLAAKFGAHVLAKTGVGTLDIDVFDLNVLEEKFFKGDLDLIFTAREPGRKKYRYRKHLGYQSLELFGEGEQVRVMSSFEYGIWETRRAKSAGGGLRSPTPASARAREGKTVISNSLAVRRHWIEHYGGEGTLPTVARVGKRRESGARVVEEDEVFLFAQDSVSPAFWERASGF